jgi:hypothetical protein
MTRAQNCGNIINGQQIPMGPRPGEALPVMQRGIFDRVKDWATDVKDASAEQINKLGDKFK